MEATPPQEPIRKKETPPPPPPEAVVRTSKRAPRPKPISPTETEIDAPPAPYDIDSEQEATRIYGALALGIMAVLLVCMIALLIAYRHAPEGL